MKKVEMTVKQWNNQEYNYQVAILKKYDVILTDFETKAEKIKRILKKFNMKNLNKGIKTMNKSIDTFIKATNTIDNHLGNEKKLKQIKIKQPKIKQPRIKIQKIKTPKVNLWGSTMKQDKRIREFLGYN